MEKNLTIVDDATARRLYKTAPAELREILENSYGKSFFSEDITDLIKTFEDACEYNNTNPLAKKFTMGTRNQIYQERVAEIVKALNQGWEPNYNDSSEYKYSPYFYLNSPGFQFLVSYCSRAASGAAGGSRFALKNRRLSDYAGTQFIKEYEYWLTRSEEKTVSMGNGCNLSGPKPYTGTSMKEWEDYIMPLVTSFETACIFTGDDPNDDNFYDGEPDEIAYKKGKVVVRALNGSWKLDWADKTQRKWEAWLEYTGPGFRFYVSGFSDSYSGTTGGSRLRLCSENLAKYFATQFPGLMMDFWL